MAMTPTCTAADPPAGAEPTSFDLRALRKWMLALFVLPSHSPAPGLELQQLMKNM